MLPRAVFPQAAQAWDQGQPLASRFSSPTEGVLIQARDSPFPAQVLPTKEAILPFHAENNQESIVTNSLSKSNGQCRKTQHHFLAPEPHMHALFEPLAARRLSLLCSCPLYPLSKPLLMHTEFSWLQLITACSLQAFPTSNPYSLILAK